MILESLNTMSVEDRENYEKICHYIVNRYQTLNSCDLVAPLVEAIANEMGLAVFRKSADVHITSKDGTTYRLPHIFNYAISKESPDSIIIIDSTIRQCGMHFDNCEVPDYFIGTLKELSSHIKYQYQLYDLGCARYSKDDIKMVAEYLKNNPKEELRNLEYDHESQKQDLYLNKKLYI